MGEAQRRRGGRVWHPAYYLPLVWVALFAGGCCPWHPHARLYVDVELDTKEAALDAELRERNCNCGSDCPSSAFRYVEGASVLAGGGDRLVTLLEEEPGDYAGVQAGAFSAYEFNLEGEIFVVPSAEVFTATAEQGTGDVVLRVSWTRPDPTSDCMQIGVRAPGRGRRAPIAACGNSIDLTADVVPALSGTYEVDLWLDETTFFDLEDGYSRAVTALATSRRRLTVTVP